MSVPFFVDSAPVREVIRNDRNEFLVVFFKPDEIARLILSGLGNIGSKRLRDAAYIAVQSYSTGYVVRNYSQEVLGYSRLCFVRDG